MGKRLISWCGLTLCSGLAACSGSESDEQLTNDGGQLPRVDAGAAPEDAGSDELDASDRMDAAVHEDAGLDASTNTEDDGGPDASSARDASLDASDEGDAGADAGAQLNVIYASFAGVLVRIDPDTAELTEVGPVRNAANTNQTYSDLVLTSTRSDDRTAWMVTSYYQTPTLATLDLCTGLATLGPALARTSPTNLVVEGLAVHSNGTVYVASGNPSNPATSPLSNHLGTLNTSTGAIADLSATLLNTYQDDCDMLFFRGDTLYGVDVATTNNLLDLFSLDLTSGANTRIYNPYPTYGGSTTVPLRIAFDDSRDKAYTWRDSDNNLLEFNMATGAVTAIGRTHPDNTYSNQPSRGFFVAPLANCDD